MEITTRKKAKNLGLEHFYTGRICQNGHMTLRRVICGRCEGCIQEEREANASNSPVVSEIVHAYIREADIGTRFTSVGLAAELELEKEYLSAVRQSILKAKRREMLEPVGKGKGEGTKNSLIIYEVTGLDVEIEKPEEEFIDRDINSPYSTLFFNKLCFDLRGDTHEKI